MLYLKLFFYLMVRSVYRRPYPNGFTLLELIVVFVILSILVTVMLPITMAQIGRARESGAKMNLSSISTAQQEYFFEHASFADQILKLSVGINDIHYNYPDPVITSAGLLVKHEAQPINAANVNIRHYSMGIFYNIDQSYTVILCQSDNPTSIAQVANTVAGGCDSGTLQN